jgi:hypothetical protein
MFLNPSSLYNFVVDLSVSAWLHILLLLSKPNVQEQVQTTHQNPFQQQTLAHPPIIFLS